MKIKAAIAFMLLILNTANAQEPLDPRFQLKFNCELPNAVKRHVQIMTYKDIGREIVGSAICDIYSTNIGKQMFFDLINERDEVYFIHVVENVYGGGTAATTRYNPNEEYTGYYTQINLQYAQKSTFKTSITTRATNSLARILIHEMGHGIYGLLDPQKGKADAPVGEDDVIALIENIYAQELGLPLRMFY